VIPFEEDEDAWPDEPEEFDPDSLGPDPPTVTRTGELVREGQDAPKEVQNAFWKAVLLANVALLGISLGAMLLYFRADWDFGGGALVVGLVALALTYRTYHQFMNRDTAAERDETETAGDD
jgi:hypothetical protein